MPEVWKQTRFAGYEVSDRGRVRSVDRVVQTANGPRCYGGKVLAPGRTASGHVTVALGRGNSQYVHVLVATAFLGEPKPGEEVRHADDNGTHNVLENLSWGSRGDNVRDRKWTRLGAGRKLTGEAASDMKTDLAFGKSGVDCAREYGCSQSVVSKVKLGGLHTDA